MKENILVCVSNPHNAEMLIQRGHQMSKAFGGECYVLCVKTNDVNELDYEWLEQKDLFEHLSSKYESTLLIKAPKAKKISSTISSVSQEYKVKQIILGQPARSKWDIIMQGSLINELFFQLEGVDLHIVEVYKQQAPNDKQYEQGVNAYLVETNDGYDLILSANAPEKASIKGLFFRGSATQFQNGLFKVMNQDKIVIYKVHDGKVDPESASIIKK